MKILYTAIKPMAVYGIFLFPPERRLANDQ